VYVPSVAVTRAAAPPAATPPAPAASPLFAASPPKRPASAASARGAPVAAPTAPPSPEAPAPGARESPGASPSKHLAPPRPASAEGGTRRVRLVRGEGRDVSSRYGREGEGGGSPRAAAPLPRARPLGGRPRPASAAARAARAAGPVGAALGALAPLVTGLSPQAKARPAGARGAARLGARRPASAGARPALSLSLSLSLAAGGGEPRGDDELQLDVPEAALGARPSGAEGLDESSSLEPAPFPTAFSARIELRSAKRVAAPPPPGGAGAAAGARVSRAEQMLASGARRRLHAALVKILADAGQTGQTPGGAAAGLPLANLAARVVGQFGVPVDRTLRFAQPGAPRPSLRAFVEEYPETFLLESGGANGSSDGADGASGPVVALSPSHAYAAGAQEAWAASRLLSTMRLAR
jgi:hypothetical protein